MPHRAEGPTGASPKWGTFSPGSAYERPTGGEEFIPASTRAERMTAQERATQRPRRALMKIKLARHARILTVVAALVAIVVDGGAAHKF